MGGRASHEGPCPGADAARGPQLWLGLTIALTLAFPLPLLSQPVLRPAEAGNQPPPPVAPAAVAGAAERPKIAQDPPPPRPETSPETASKAAAETLPTSRRPERKPDNSGAAPPERPATAEAGNDLAAPPPAPVATAPEAAAADPEAATGPSARPETAGAESPLTSPDPTSDAAPDVQDAGGGTAPATAPPARPDAVAGAAPAAPDPPPKPPTAASGDSGASPDPASSDAPDAARPDTAAGLDPAAVPLYQSLRESSFDHAVCRLGLRLLGVEATAAPPVTDPDNRDCGIARPVEVHSIQPGLRLENPAVMRCETARQLALWMRGTVIPAARWLDGSPRIASVALGTSYACRGVVGGASTANLSEHALGNAVDIAGFGFDNGERLAIAPRGDSGTIEMAFQNAVQAGACLYFATVLGPGSNEAHDDHLHLDIKARRNGFRLCQ